MQSVEATFNIIEKINEVNKALKAKPPELPPQLQYQLTSNDITNIQFYVNCYNIDFNTAKAQYLNDINKLNDGAPSLQLENDVDQTRSMNVVTNNPTTHNKPPQPIIMCVNNISSESISDLEPQGIDEVCDRVSIPNSGENDVDLDEEFNKSINNFKVDQVILRPVNGTKKLVRDHLRCHGKPLSKSLQDKCAHLIDHLYVPISVKDHEGKPCPKVGFLEYYYGNEYKKVIKILETGTEKKGPIIEQTKEYYTSYTNKYGQLVPGRARYYKLTDKYRTWKTTSYVTDQKKSKSLNVKVLLHKNELIERSKINPIAHMCMRLTNHVTAPTIDQVLARADEMHKNVSKRGRLYKFGTNLKESEKNRDKYRYLEEDIQRWKYYTEDGYRIPTYDETYGRVIDSFAMMPSWIRELYLINGKKTQFADLTALHPNLLLNYIKPMLSPESVSKIESIQDGYNYDLHQYIADKGNLNDRDVAKTAHLSLLNKRPQQLENDPIWKVWCSAFPAEVSKIILDIKNDYSYFDDVTEPHKNITKIIFNEETAFIKKCSEELGSRVAMQTFDEMGSDINIKQIMEKVIKDTNLKLGVSNEY